MQTNNTLQRPSIADGEASEVAVPPARSCDQPGTEIDAGVLSSALHNVRSEHSLARTDVENPLLGLRFEQVEDRRNGEGAMVLTTAIANPAVVPTGDSIPARASWC